MCIEHHLVSQIPGEYRIIITDSYEDCWQTANVDEGYGNTEEVDGVQIAEMFLATGSEDEVIVTIFEGSQFAK